MDSEDFESEEFLVSKSIGLAFHRFDFVVGAFQRACGNGVIVVSQDSQGVEAKGLGGGLMGDLECHAGLALLIENLMNRTKGARTEVLSVDESVCPLERHHVQFSPALVR